MPIGQDKGNGITVPATEFLYPSGSHQSLRFSKNTEYRIFLTLLELNFVIGTKFHYAATSSKVFNLMFQG